MKGFFKKIAFVMALAMILTNIGPVATASAAPTPSLKYKSRVLYVGGSAFDDYPEWCWTPSQNTDGYTVSYEVTTGKNIIEVASNGKITTTGNAIGKAVVRVTYDDGVNKAITENFTLKVRRNATAVRLTNATIKAVEEALTVGQEINLVAAKSATTPVSYAKGNYGLNNYMSVVSDQIAYTVDNEEVIKVEGNTLTAVGAGTATLTVFAYEYLDDTKTPVCSQDYVITVVGGIAKIEQKNLKTFDVTFAQELEKAPATDEFVITKNDELNTKLNVAINTTKLSDDNKKLVTLTTFVDLNDGAEYVLTYDGKEYPFTVTNGVAYNITINQTTVEYDTETEITFYVNDAKGVVIKEAKIGSPDGKLDFTFDDMLNGYTNGDKLVVWEKGKSVKITATYHSGEYDTKTGQEINNISQPFTITAVDQKVVSAGDLKYTIRDIDAPNWDDYTKNSEIYVKETGRYMHIYLTNSKGEDLSLTGNYTLESADENVLIIGEATSNGNKGVRAPISAVSKTGTVNVIVKKDGKVWTTIPITIKPEKVFATFEVGVDKNTVSNANTNVYDKSKITLTFKDQYGNKINIGDDVEVKSLSRPINGEGSGSEALRYLGISSTTDTGAATAAGETLDIYFNAAGAVHGTYNYRITYKNVSRSVSIVVQNANVSGANPVYRLEMSATNIDTIYNKDNQSDKTVTIRVAKLVNGVVVKYMPVSDYNITVQKGADTFGYAINGVDDEGTTDTAGTKAVVTLRTVTGSTVTGSVVTKVSTGSYMVKATNLPNAAFVVTDSQKAMTGKIVSPTVTSVSDYEEAIKKAFEFYYDGGSAVDKGTYNVVKIKTANQGVIENSDVQGLAKGNQIYVTSVVIQYNLPETTSNVYYEYEVTLNRTITINN